MYKKGLQMARSVVLLSGGLDSTVNLTKAVSETEVALVLYFDYGHKSAQKEITAFRKITSHHKVKSRVISLPWLETITHSAMVDPRKAIPTPNNIDEIDKPMYDSVFSRWSEEVWVPNRLGIMLNIAAAYADSFESDYIILGLNNTRGSTNPEHSQPFYSSLNQFLENSTLTVPQVVSYTGPMTKAQILAHGLEIKAPLELIWDCYNGDAKMCGSCESCLRLLRAVNESNNQAWFDNLRKMKTPE